MNAEKITSFIAEETARANDQGPDRGLFRTPTLTGFSSPDDPLFEEIIRQVGPHHRQPRDILPEVGTVVSFFLPFSREVVEANRRDKPVARLWGRAYLTANRLIDRIGESLAEMVRAEGGLAATVPATRGFDPQTLQTGWSHRSAAFVAGLGRFGLNRMLIGPAGGAGRYGTVLISEVFEPSPRPEEDLCLHFRKGSCRVCLAACPVGALSVDGFDGHRCHAQCLSNNEFLRFDDGQCDICGQCVTTGPCAIR